MKRLTLAIAGLLLALTALGLRTSVGDAGADGRPASSAPAAHRIRSVPAPIRSRQHGVRQW